MNQRNHERQAPTRSTVLVETCEGAVVRATVADESLSGGVGLVFESDPKLAVDSIITVWFRFAPRSAMVKNVTMSSGAHRVGLQWLEERSARPFGT
jgi:hypothetical protein